MPWPSTTQYNEAIQNLRTSVSDEELRAGELARTSLGLPMLWSGNFADVYKVHCPATGNTWAVKCFTRESPGLKDRYREISAHLNWTRLPFMVDFQFVEPGLRVGREWHPFLKMRWVEGFVLNQFVADYVENRRTLKLLLPMWVKLSEMLRKADIAHCDLQHGNVLLVPAGEGGQLGLKLIDYDGMYVPSLAGRRSAELGHPSYQHPQRLREGSFGPEVDRFSHLAIYCGIRCLITGGRALWERFSNGENLLFREADHKAPGASEVFRHLWSVRNPDVHALVGRVILATQMPLDRVPLLEEVASNGSAVPLSGEEERKAAAVLDRGAAVARRRGRGIVPGVSGQAVEDAANRSGTAETPWWVSARPGEAFPGPVFPSTGTAGEPAASRVARGRVARGVQRSLTAALQRGRGLLGAAAKRAGLPPGVVLALGLGAVVLLLGIMGIAYVGTRFAQTPAPPSEREITVDLGGGVTMEMVLIPTGSFQMGSPVSDPDAGSDEKPQHQVRITQPFYLGKYEVTQEQWQAVMGGNPSRFTGLKNPVDYVSWNDCQAFLARLNEKSASTGVKFSLPTEAQWEYACRAGTTTRWSFGDDEATVGDYAWYGGNSRQGTPPVGQKQPNAWGLYDMHGNVWEWCVDWYDGDYYSTSPPDDPTGPDSGTFRVLRGGSWLNSASNGRSATRRREWPSVLLHDHGFRVARTHVVVSEFTRPTEPLRITPIAPRTTEVGKLLTIVVSVENARYWQGKLTYSFGPQAPAEARIDPNTGTFRWTPTEEQGPGTYDVTVSVAGPDGQKDQKSFRITVARFEEITIELDAGVTMEMVLIPAGQFMMGSPDSDRDAGSHEKPEHQVRITQPFYLGKYEVTQEQWQAVMGNNPSGFKDPNNPVENVSWDDFQAFLTKLNEKYTSTGVRFGLPTEAQWEYACRAGSTTRWCFGDDEASLEEYAWYSENSGRMTHAVGHKRANAWGLYDMHGNVREWCADRYASGYYRTSPPDDPAGPASGGYRVVRGGSWVNIARYARSAYRDGDVPGYRVNIGGFRVSRTP